MNENVNVKNIQQNAILYDYDDDDIVKIQLTNIKE